MSTIRTRTASRPARLGGAVPVVVLVAVMWVSEIIDTAMPFLRLDYFGIRPRDLEGLPGIVFSPFLHFGFEHLIANTTALLVLGALVAWTTRHLLTVSLGVILLGGLGVWLLGGANTIIIGASGLVYGYIAFLLVYGFTVRRFVPVLAAILVGVLYGGAVWGLLPIHPGVSWQAHLFGALAGVLLALQLGRRDRPVKRFVG